MDLRVCDSADVEIMADIVSCVRVALVKAIVEYNVFIVLQVIRQSQWRCFPVDGGVFASICYISGQLSAGVRYPELDVHTKRCFPPIFAISWCRIVLPDYDLDVVDIRNPFKGDVSSFCVYWVVFVVSRVTTTSWFYNCARALDVCGAQ